MRILIIHTQYQQFGGEDTSVINESELLRKKGHTVEILYFKNKCYHFPLYFFNPFSFVRVLWKIISFYPHVIHLQNLFFAASLSVLYACRGFKTVQTLQNYRLICPDATMQTKLYRNSKIASFYMNLCHNIHWRIINNQNYIVLSDHMKEILPFKNMIVKPHFCPNQKMGLHREDYYLYVGRLSSEKGIELLLSSGLDEKIAIVGTGPLLDQVKKSKCVYFGFKPYNKVIELMSEAKALIFPTQWEEPFGLIVIEAFSVGLPVIGTNKGALKNLIKEGYNGFHFNSIAELKHSLNRITPIMYNNAYDSHLKYSLENNYRLIMDAYRHYFPDLKLLSINANFFTSYCP